MHKDGRGHSEDDADQRPVLSTVLAIVSIVVLAGLWWWIGG